MMKIAWVTPQSFVDVDLPIIAELQKTAEIYWQILVGRLTDDMRLYVKSQLDGNSNLKYEFVETKYRVYDIRTLFLYIKVLKKAKAYKADVYYTSLQTAPFGPMVYKCCWPMKNTVTACHNVSTPKGANREHYARFYTNLTLRAFNNIQVFSESQQEVLKQRFPNKNVLLAPLAIKDYGEPSSPRREFKDKEIVFLFFGIISPYKRLDLLIEAAQEIYERGFRNFKVKIRGKCKNWPQYESLIKYQHLFDCRIEFIPNADVADIFAECDYFVMPYQDIAQSGAITVAFRYDLPVILSDLSQFRPYGDEGKTGFFFKSGDAHDLGEKMITVLKGGGRLHEELRRGLSDFVKERYSTPAIARRYMNYFEGLLEQK